MSDNSSTGSSPSSASGDFDFAFEVALPLPFPLPFRVSAGFAVGSGDAMLLLGVASPPSFGVL